MSRFFAGSDSDDTSSSSEDEMSFGEEQSEEPSDMDQVESDEEDEDESEEESTDDETRGATLRRDYFIKGAASDESDEDEGKRVVKSARDKRLQEIEATIKSIENGGKINDWVVISNGIAIQAQS
jgi:translation initiation factor 3 subunit C